MFSRMSYNSLFVCLFSWCHLTSIPWLFFFFFQILFYFLKKIFDVDHFKVFIEFITILLLLYVLVYLAVSHVGSELLDRGLNPHPLC